MDVQSPQQKGRLRGKVCGINVLSAFDLVINLQRYPQTAKQLAANVGIERTTCLRWLRALRRKEKIYIFDYKLIGTNWTILWFWGDPLDDAPKPKTMTSDINKYHRDRRARKRNVQSNRNLSC